jgi:cytochrome P450
LRLREPRTCSAIPLVGRPATPSVPTRSTSNGPTLSDTSLVCAFGHGIHYCMSGRLAEMQHRVLWEGMLPRFERVEVHDEPGRTFSTFVNGYASLPAVVSRK